MPSVEQIHQEIQNKIDDFNKDIPKLQNEALRKVINVLKDLDTRSGKLVNSLSNLRKLRRLKSEILDAILTKNYRKEVDQYIASFKEVETLQSAYFSSTFKKFKTLDAITELRRQTIVDVGITLGETGLESTIVVPAQEIIRRNLASGSDFATLVEEMQGFLTQTETGVGALARHSGTYTTDTLNIFAAEYDQAVTDDLGLMWSKYLGAIVKDSREFCVHLVAKKFVHNSEIPTIINDHPESPFSLSKKGLIDGKRVSLAGLKKETKVSNFRILRGGWRCQHRLVPISDQAVPESLRKKFA